MPFGRPLTRQPRRHDHGVDSPHKIDLGDGKKHRADERKNLRLRTPSPTAIRGCETSRSLRDRPSDFLMPAGQTRLTHRNKVPGGHAGLLLSFIDPGSSFGRASWPGTGHIQ
jgi:hypothetical protein